MFLLVGGAVGLVASLTLTIERFKLFLDPGYVPSCSLNPVLSCGSVMTTSQAAVLGFPNPIVGIGAFAVVVVTGVLTVAGVILPRWYWVGLSVGLAGGVVFIHWLIFQSVYRIGALCPYCMAVWAVTVPLWVVTTTAAVQPVREHSPLSVALRWRWTAVSLWFTALVLVVLERFWDYWSTLL
ncbi:vitamin K epoxide reductase family protein [Rhodococcus wratislaviensis]|uniref:vitamin K epoxide reductase family protein n=1 Tax=Rhodococcus wratislaviensis TaxID=44752 RepID=UPI0036604710